MIAIISIVVTIVVFVFIIIYFATLAPTKPGTTGTTATIAPLTETQNTKSSLFSPNGCLTAGQKLISDNNKYSLVYQTDGNVVIMNGSTPIWACNAYDKIAGGGKLCMQNDGNLVAYKPNNTPHWETATYNKGGTPPYVVIMQNDGNLVIYDSNKKVIWASDTVGK